MSKVLHKLVTSIIAITLTTSLMPGCTHKTRPMNPKTLGVKTLAEDSFQLIECLFNATPTIALGSTLNSLEFGIVPSNCFPALALQQSPPLKHQSTFTIDTTYDIPNSAKYQSLVRNWITAIQHTCSTTFCPTFSLQADMYIANIQLQGVVDDTEYSAVGSNVGPFLSCNIALNGTYTCSIPGAVMPASTRLSCLPGTMTLAVVFTINGDFQYTDVANEIQSLANAAGWSYNPLYYWGGLPFTFTSPPLNVSCT